MNRRGFLGSIIAACAAPAIVRADALMRVVPVETAVITESVTYTLPGQIAVWERVLGGWRSYVSDGNTLFMDHGGNIRVEYGQLRRKN